MVAHTRCMATDLVSQETLREESQLTLAAQGKCTYCQNWISWGQVLQTQLFTLSHDSLISRMYPVNTEAEPTPPSAKRPKKSHLEPVFQGVDFLTNQNQKFHDSMAFKNPQVEIPDHADQENQPHPLDCTHVGCNATFTRKDHLNRHVLIHSGIKPLRCPHPGCTKTFNRKDYLKTHERSHNQAPPPPDQVIVDLTL